MNRVRGIHFVLAAAAVATAATLAGGASLARWDPSVDLVQAASVADGAPAADPAPPGWTVVTSPWIGYAVTVPTSWGLRGHVNSNARAPYDVFEGTIDGSSLTALLVVGCSPVSVANTTGRPIGRVTVDGTTMELFQSPADDAAWMILIAKGTRGDREWHLMARTPRDVDALAFFKEVVTTFRFPAPTPPAVDPQ